MTNVDVRMWNDGMDGYLGMLYYCGLSNTQINELGNFSGVHFTVVMLPKFRYKFWVVSFLANLCVRKEGKER